MFFNYLAEASLIIVDTVSFIANKISVSAIVCGFLHLATI